MSRPVRQPTHGLASLIGMDAHRSISLALVVFGLIGAGCADDPGTTPPLSSPTETSQESPDAETPSDEPTATKEVALEVWLTSGDSLRPVLRRIGQTPGVARAAVEMLLEGPTDRESELEVSSQVPEGVDLLDIAISDGIATVDLSGGFEEGGGSATMRMRLGQLIYTLTQFDTVSGVLLRLDGKPVETFSSEGIVIEEPQKRKGYRDLLPQIVVTHPGIDDRATSPLEISGTANVFEATVSFRLVVDGNELASGFATATCGTGCRGTYEGMLEFDVKEETEAVLEVFESSAEDGSPLFMISVPLRLLP